MTRYAVGDLQGCLKPLQCLLQDVDFKPEQDQLWLVGDLINRGPESLKTLEFLIGMDKKFPDAIKIVLGNHDLNFLAIYYGHAKIKRKDTIEEILLSENCEKIVDWLCQQPLLYTDPSGDYTMSHAGIPPIWSLLDAQHYASEVEVILKNPKLRDEYFSNMYGNQPNTWSDNLEGWDRLRLITNYLTRMRFCKSNGELDLKNKTSKSDKPEFKPWFSFAEHKANKQSLIFGHWAALEGKVNEKNIFALDTGCVWGGSLSIMNLETRKVISCDCHN